MQSVNSSHMRLAISQARQALLHGDAPFGAVIGRGDEVVVAVENAEAQRADVTAHAEMIAVSEACRQLGRRDLSDCTIYSSMEPCPMCSAAIFQSNISRVVFAVSRDDLPNIFRQRAIRIAQLADDWDYQPEVIGGVLKEEGLKVFEGVDTSLRIVPRYLGDAKPGA